MNKVFKNFESVYKSLISKFLNYDADISNIVKLYHLSEKNHNGEIYLPRVPKTTGRDENKSIRRICFAKTISGAWRALPIGGSSNLTGREHYINLWVHVPENKIKPTKIHEVTTDEVYDADITDEVWVTTPVKMKCIGRVRIGSDTWQKNKRYPVHFKWLEHFN